MHELLLYEGKKGDLIRASLKLFAEKGYAAVSVRDIAKVAGVSEAALYKHFKGKEAMALHVFTAIISAYTCWVQEIHAAGGGAVDKLCRIVELTYELYRQYPAEIKFILLSQYAFWDLAPEEIKPHFVLRAILEQGMAEAEIPRQDVYLWISVYSGIMLQPLVQYPYFHDVLPPLDELKDRVIGIVRCCLAQKGGEK